MKEIKIFEQAMHEDNEFFRTHQLNLTLFTAYRQQKHTGNELLDFSEVVWEEDIAAISEFLKAEGKPWSNPCTVYPLPSGIILPRVGASRNSRFQAPSAV